MVEGGANRATAGNRSTAVMNDLTRDPLEVDVAVDVAVPVFRRATYIAEAIESVLAQTFEDWSLTICDNGAGGGAIEAAVEPYLSDRRVSYRPTGEELAIAENWTRAINQGAAPYVALLHDDDRWHPGFLRARVDALESNRECAFAFGDYVHVEGDGMEVDRSPIRFPEGPLTREVLADAFARECIVKPPTVLVRRSAYEAVGARFSGEWKYCDWEMWARLAARFPAYYVALQDSDFRRHESTQSVVGREQPAQFIAMLDSIESMFRREVEGFELSRVDRARNRSRMLLTAARDVHPSGGWRASRHLYLRSLATYPPAFFSLTSLRMVAHTVLGRRLSRVVGRGLRLVHPHRGA
jgi:glycosyltransferase involved in cell wall biosynthesis